MAGVGFVLSLIFVPTIRSKVDQVMVAPKDTSIEKVAVPQVSNLGLLAKFNPIRVLKQFLHPEVLLAVSALPVTHHTLHDYQFSSQTLTRI